MLTSQVTHCSTCNEGWRLMPGEQCPKCKRRRINGWPDNESNSGKAISGPLQAVGGYLRFVRQEKGFTLRSFARAANVSPTYVSLVERGLTQPSTARLREFASILEIPMPQQPVPITGLWLRVQDGRVQTLLEIDGQWRLIHNEPLLDGIPTLISDIMEPDGIRTLSIPDPLGEDA